MGGWEKKGSLWSIFERNRLSLGRDQKEYMVIIISWGEYRLSSQSLGYLSSDVPADRGKFTKDHVIQVLNKNPAV